MRRQHFLHLASMRRQYFLEMRLRELKASPTWRVVLQRMRQPYSSGGIDGLLNNLLEKANSELEGDEMLKSSLTEQNKFATKEKASTWSLK